MRSTSGSFCALLVFLFLTLSGRATSYLYQDFRNGDAYKTAPGGVSGNIVVGNYSNSAGVFGELPFRYAIDTGRFDDIPIAPGANATVAMGIDGHDIVGTCWANYPSGPIRGFIYNLDAPAESAWTFLDIEGSSAPAIFGKSGDWIAGPTGKGSGAGFIKNIVTGAYRELIAPGADATGTRILAISGNLVVGDYRPDGRAHGITYTITSADGNGTWGSPFDPPGSTDTHINGANGHKILGQFNDSTGLHAFIYDLDAPPASAYSTLEDFAGTYTGAIGMSDDKVVGYYVAGIMSGFLATIVDGTTSSDRLTVPFVDPSDASKTLCRVAFTSVSAPGETSVSISGSGPAEPAGFQLGEPNRYFHVATTAATGGAPITVSFNIAGISFTAGEPILYHYHDGAWAAVEGATVSGDLITGTVTSLSPFAVFAPPLVSNIQPPIAANGSSIFPARRGTVPVKFDLTAGGLWAKKLPPATITLFRNGSEVPVPSYRSPSEHGADFRVAGHQYIYNLGADGLTAGTYIVQILLDGQPTGSATFKLK